MVRHNLEREMVLARMRPGSFDRMLDSLNEQLLAGTISTDLEPALEEFCCLAYADAENRAGSWRGAFASDTCPFFQASSGPNLASRRRVYTSMPLTLFAVNCWQNTPLTTGRRPSARAIDAAKARAWTLLGDPTAFAMDLQSEGLRFGNAFHFFWLADFDSDLETLIKGRPGDAAGWLRSQTGTAHFGDDRLVALSLETRVLSNSEVRCPTVMDARGYAYFRPSCRTDGWGESLNLDDKKTGRCEAIHAEALLTDGVSPIRVGELGAPVHYGDSDWDEVLAFSRGEFDARRSGAAT